MERVHQSRSPIGESNTDCLSSDHSDDDIIIETTLPLSSSFPFRVRRSDSCNSSTSSTSSGNSTTSTANSQRIYRESITRSDSFSDVSTITTSLNGVFFDENDEESGHGASNITINRSWANFSSHSSALTLTSSYSSSSSLSRVHSFLPTTPHDHQLRPILQLSALSPTSTSSSSLSQCWEEDEDTIVFRQAPLARRRVGHMSSPALRRRYLDSCRSLTVPANKVQGRSLQGQRPTKSDSQKKTTSLFSPYKRKKCSLSSSIKSGVKSTGNLMFDGTKQSRHHDPTHLVLTINMMWIVGILVVVFVFPAVLPPSINTSLLKAHNFADYTVLYDNAAAVDAATSSVTASNTALTTMSAVDAVVYIAAGPVVFSEVLSWSIESVVVQGQWRGPIYVITDKIAVAQRTLRKLMIKGSEQFVFVELAADDTLSPARAAKIAKSQILDLVPSTVQMPLYLDSDIIVGQPLDSFWMNLNHIWNGPSGDFNENNDVTMAIAEDAKAFTLNRCYACDTWNTGIISMRRGKSEQCLKAWHDELVQPTSLSMTDQAALDHVIATTNHCSNIRSIDTKVYVRMMKDVFVVAGLVPLKTFNHFTGLFASAVNKELSIVHRYSYQRDIRSSIGRDLYSVRATNVEMKSSPILPAKSSRRPRFTSPRSRSSAPSTSEFRLRHTSGVWDSTLL